MAANATNPTPMGDLREGEDQVMPLIADGLRVRRDSVVRDIARHVAGRLEPGSGRGPAPSAAAAGADIAARIVDHVIRLIETDQPPGDDDIAMLAAFAARRAHDGLPRRAVHEAISVSLGVIWDAAVHAVTSLPPGHRNTLALGRIGATLAQLGDQLPRILAGRGAHQNAATFERAQQFASILSGEVSAEQAATQLSSPPGSERRPRAYVIAAIAPLLPDGDREPVRDVAQRICAGAPDAVDVPLTSHLTGHRTVVVVSSANSASALASKLDRMAAQAGVLVLLSGSTEPGGLSNAYRRCVRLVEVAQRMHLRPGLVDPIQLRTVALASVSEEECRWFVDETVGPILALPPGQRDTFLQTLDLLQQTGSSGGKRKVAELLNLDRKSIYYRLERIRCLTGLDYDIPIQRLQLEIGMQLLRFLGHPLPRRTMQPVRLAVAG